MSRPAAPERAPAGAQAVLDHAGFQFGFAPGMPACSNPLSRFAAHELFTAF
jgi:hypothetical protein